MNSMTVIEAVTATEEGRVTVIEVRAFSLSTEFAILFDDEGPIGKVEGDEWPPFKAFLDSTRDEDVLRILKHSAGEGLGHYERWLT